MEQKIFLAIRMALCILLCLYIVFYQRPIVDQQVKALEMQKQIYEAQKMQWMRDSIRRAHEIKLLDSALYRIKNFR